MANKIDNPLFPSARAGAGKETVRTGKSEGGKPLSGAAPATPVQLNTDDTVVEMSSAQPAGTPTLDLAKIQAVRHALESGTYRIDPEEIAARLTALERELSK